MSTGPTKPPEASRNAPGQAPVAPGKEDTDRALTPSELAAKSERTEEEGEEEKREEEKGAGTVAVERILDFMANAEGGTLVAVFVAGSAVLYMIAGRLGILLVGIAGGVLLRQSFDTGHGEKRTSSLDVLRILRGEKGLEVTKLQSNSDVPDLSSLPPETREAMQDLVGALVKDYVEYWYTSLVPINASFPNIVRTSVTKIALRIHHHLYAKRATDLLLIFIITIANTLIVFFRELSLALEKSGSDTYSPEAIQCYLEDYPQSALGQLLDRREQQHRLHQCAEILLATFLEKELYDCEPLRTFLTEITGAVVLERIVDKMSKPEFLSEWAVYLLDDETKPKFLAKLDLGEAEEDLENIGEKLQQKVGQGKEDDAMERAVREAEEMSRLLAETDKKRLSQQQRTATPPPNGTARAAPVPSERPELPPRPASNGFQDRPPSASSQRRSPPRPLNSTPPRSTRPGHKIDLSIDGVEQRRLQTFGRHYSGEMLPDGAESHFEGGPTSRQSTSHYEGGHASRQSTSSQRSIPATSFDQMDLPPPPPSAPPTTAQKMTLHTATATLTSMSDSPQRPLRSKPTAAGYFIMIEPNIPNSTGWMLSRTYPEFESLHETLRRIASVSQARSFIERYPVLPPFKSVSHEDLGKALEAYLNLALSERDLAESSALERFFKKNEENMGLAQNRGMVNPFAAIGKGLASAPMGFRKMGMNVGEGVMGVVKDVQGTVEKTGGVLGGVFAQRRGSALGGSGNNSQDSLGAQTPSLNGNGTARPLNGNYAPMPYTSAHERNSSSSLASINTSYTPHHPTTSDPSLVRSSSSSSSSLAKHTDTPQTARPDSLHASRYTEADRLAEKNLLDRYIQLEVPSDSSRGATPGEEKDVLNLPPPPSDMPDDFDLSHTAAAPPPPTKPAAPSTSKEPESTLTPQDTLFYVDIVFSLLTELYTLSPSTSLLRRRLLSLSKSVLLRPGTPTLSNISTMISRGISSQTSDAAIASLVLKVRKNIAPTPAEILAWERKLADRERIERKKGEPERARVLVGSRLVPRGIRGVMGERASRECSECLWDAVVGSSLGRALVVAVVVEGVRGVCQ